MGSAVNLKIQTKDRYRRTVAEIFRNGRSVNLAMVQSGQAFAYRKYLAACDSGAYLAAEAQAQQVGRGVWAVTGGIERPWVWRHRPSRAASSRSAPPPASSAPGTVTVASTAAPAGHQYTCNEIGNYATA